MNDLIISAPRRVIPRWRGFETTLSIGELEPIKNKTSNKTINVDFQKATKQWINSKSILSGTELLIASIINKNESTLMESTSYLLNESTNASQIVKDFAIKAIHDFNSGESSITKNQISNSAKNFDSKLISLVRNILKTFPFSPIHWVDLALFYSIIGKNEKAKRAIYIALHLAPDDRFVLRSATRLFLHQDNPEAAKRILGKSSRTKNDSWLLAAQMSVSAILGEHPLNYKIGKELGASKNISPFHLSELNATLATLELNEGNYKGANKFFKQALVDPTENVVAQFIWANKNMVIKNSDVLFNLPRSFETNARAHYNTYKWKEALEFSILWHQDEPFSARPSILGSFISSTTLEDYDTAIKICRAGLESNPDDQMLLNNLAFSLASSNQGKEARKIFSKIPISQELSDTKAINIATDGLIDYRTGNPNSGSEKYKKAIEYYRKNNLIDYLARAFLYYAREEIIAKSKNANEVIKEAFELAKKSKDPIVEVQKIGVQKELNLLKE